MSPRSSGPPRQQQRRNNPAEVFFDPEKPDVELFDVLAEKQADKMPDRPKINSSQLRRFFGEIKDLYRQFQARSASAGEDEKQQIYQREIEPRFKMVRSKVAYARRPAGQSKVPREFADMLERGIEKVRPGNCRDFERYVTHLEAVVGFMYGKGKVS